MPPSPLLAYSHYTPPMDAVQIGCFTHHQGSRPDVGWKTDLTASCACHAKEFVTGTGLEWPPADRRTTAADRGAIAARDLVLGKS